MTVAEMLSLLKLRLGIEDGNPFSDANLYLFLNNAQNKVIDNANKNLISNLQEISEDESLVASTYFPVTQLEEAPYGGVSSLTVQRADNDKYFQRISYEEYMDHINGVDVIRTHVPVFYIQKDRIYPVGYTGDLNLYYIREPNTMTESVECELSDTLHPVVMDFAEAEAWRTIWEGDKEQVALARAYGELQRLNEKFPTTGDMSGGDIYGDGGMRVADL